MTLAYIVLAAGKSERFSAEKRKQYLALGNETVLSKSVASLLRAQKSKYLAIAFPQDETEQKIRNILFSDKTISYFFSNTKILFVQGGSTRQESVYKTLCALKKENENIDIVLIHDASRPFVTKKIILDVIEKTKECGSAIPAIKTVDTQKIIFPNGEIKTHLDRNFLVSVQTPQGFDFKKIVSAHEKAIHDKNVYTDDAAIFSNYEGASFIVAGDEVNKKITFQSDIEFMKKKEMRIGCGSDFHALASGRKLMIGGVHIPFEKGEVAHSDGDALLHAIIDALLGASRLGDVGSFFPDTDSKYKNADSKKLLQFAWNEVQKKGFKLCNLDCIITLEKPKLLPFRNEIIHSIANVLSVSSEQIFVKAKTAESLGEVGSGNAIETFCTCLLEREI